jgi:hypothetical protein
MFRKRSPEEQERRDELKAQELEKKRQKKVADDERRELLADQQRQNAADAQQRRAKEEARRRTGMQVQVRWLAAAGINLSGAGKASDMGTIYIVDDEAVPGFVFWKLSGDYHVFQFEEIIALQVNDQPVASSGVVPVATGFINYVEMSAALSLLGGVGSTRFTIAFTDNRELTFECPRGDADRLLNRLSSIINDNRRAAEEAVPAEQPGLPASNEPAQRFCSNCGSPVVSASHFCAHCGTALV